MLRGKDKVLEWFDMCIQSSHLLWKITQGKSTNKVIAAVIFEEDSGDEERTPKNQVSSLKVNSENAKQRLSDALNLLQPGDYNIICKNRVGQGKGQLETVFLIPDEKNYQHGVGGMQVMQGGFLTEEQVTKRIADAQKLWEQDAKLRELNDLIKELKSSSGNRGLDRFLSAIEPHMGTIVESFVGKPAAVGVSGFTDKKKAEGTITDAEAEAQEKEWENVVEQFIEARPADALELFKKILKIAKEEPAKVEMFKTML